MKRVLALWLLGLLISVQVFAQDRKLSGTVTDAVSGEALIGVNVTGKGTTIGTVTDLDGKYTLDLPKEVTALVFSYVGYTTVEKPITTLVIDVAMSAEGQQIEDIVVTGLAIKREKRSTSFATNTVTSEDFNQGATSVFGALQAKAPGVRINNASGAPGSSTRIVLQGESSFGNNNALLIVDGIPINNNVSTGVQNNSGSFVDFGNRGNDFNPDDVESITVLQGPAAVAIYGSRATSGVILITTKSGKGFDKADKKFNVSVNSGVTFDRAYLQIKRQDRYGQGYDNAPDPIENFSWGPAFDGVVRPWTPPVVTPEGTISQLIRPYAAVENQLQNAFNIGTTVTNGLAIEGGSDKFSYYFSYGNINNKGIFENNYYKRNTVTANATAKLSDKLTSRFNFQYAKINQRVLTGAGSSNFGGPYQALLQQAVNIPLNELRDYNSIYHDFAGYYGGYTANPYFLMNNINNDNKADNILASVELEYKPMKYITLTGRVGDNYTLSSSFLQDPKYTYVRSGGAPGSYAEVIDKRNQMTVDAFATYSQDVIKNLNITAMVGYNFNEQRSNTLQGETQGGLIIPGFYDLSNSVSPAITSNASSLYRIMGAFGTVRVGYKNMLFAEYTARNDWSSTLPIGNNSFFYQAGGLSFVPTELWDDPKNWLGYMKIRVNAGTQGKDAGLYLLNSTFDASPQYQDYSDNQLPLQFPVIGLDGSTVSGFTLGNFIGNPELKPELTIAYEAGVEMDVLKDYLHVEYTFRNKLSKDLIVNVSLPGSSGFRTTAKNVGEVLNREHSILTRITAIRNVKGINWNFRLQFARNVNEVKKVSDESDELALSTGGIQVVVKEGLPFGTFKALDFVRDPEGRIVVNANGAPVASSTYNYFGSYQPDYTMGFGSNFSWKGLTLDVQFDVRQGGQFYSGTKNATDFNGTSLTSMVNDRQPYIIPNSVVQQTDGSYVENTTPMTNLFTMIGSYPESQDLVDASYIKLREASIGYTFDKKFFKNAPISAITISLIGRNLKFWLPSENVFADPESNSFGMNGNVQGLEFSSTPASRNVGFDLRIKF